MPEREVSSNKSDPSENQITESVASPQDGDEEGKTPCRADPQFPSWRASMSSAAAGPRYLRGRVGPSGQNQKR